MEAGCDALDLHQDAEWEDLAVIFMLHVRCQGFRGNILKHYWSQKIKSGMLKSFFQIQI